MSRFSMHYWHGVCSISVFILAAAALVIPIERSEAAGHAAAFNLLDLQVFAKRNIQANHSDFQGSTAAGGDIDLSDFEIRGDLMAGGHVSFRRGSVSGVISAQTKVLTQVSDEGDSSAKNLDFDLASHRLDQLSARMENLPITVEMIAHERVENDRPVKHIAIAAHHSLDVVELKADQIMLTWPDRTSIDIHGDDTTRLIVRVLGSSPRLQHVGFSLTGGIQPADVLFFFPQATALEISDSGGALDGSGRSVGVPGSIIAPNASFRLGSALVTGQVFAKDILPISGSPTGQVDQPANVGAQLTAQNSTSISPSRILMQLDADLSSPVRCATAAN